MTSERQQASEEFARRFDEALSLRGMTIASLQHHLGERGHAMGTSTLKSWRAGRRAPRSDGSLRAIREIEEILDLPDEGLSRAIPHNRAGRPLSPPKVIGADSRAEMAVAALLHDLDAAPDEAIWVRSDSTTIVVDERGSRASVASRALIEAVGQPVRRLLHVIQSAGHRDPPPIITASRGATVAGQYMLLDGQLHATLVELDRELLPGRTALLEIEQQFPPGTRPSRTNRVSVMRRAQEVVQWYLFHPDAVPDWIEEFSATQQSRGREILRFRQLESGPSVHIARAGFGPGYVGLRWGYDRELSS